MFCLLGIQGRSAEHEAFSASDADLAQFWSSSFLVLRIVCLDGCVGGRCMVGVFIGRICVGRIEIGK